jgi:hypothetical protein
MAYAVVQDVPASWEQYARIAEAMGDPGPPGLIVHVAGPTDEGFRTIDVWETRDAWQRWCQGQRTEAVSLWAPPTLRELSAACEVRGVEYAIPPGTTASKPTTKPGSARAR